MATPKVAPSKRDLSYDYEPDEGRIVQPVAESSVLAQLNKSEIDQQITTAKSYPRSLQEFRQEALEMVTLTEEIATECIYALPRDGKTIEGPSARFAEVILCAWGNARAGARTISEDEQFVTAQGAFYDLQRNVAISYEVKRRITDRNGRRYSADMIGVTSNAACSIALRNAICKGIPKAFWASIYQAARKTIAGDFKTLANRRAAALGEFQIFGVTPELIFRALNVKGVEDITIDHLVTLKGFLTALKDGETSPEQLFGEAETALSRAQALRGHIKDANDNKLQNFNQAAASPQEGESDPSAAPTTEQQSAPASAHSQESTDEPFNAESAAESIVESFKGRKSHSSRPAHQHGGRPDVQGVPGVFSE